MGLDMYLIGRKDFWPDWNDPKNNRTEDGYKVDSLKLELGYWRKHANLHGYIVKTFAKGVDECQVIGLNKAQLEQIIEAVKAKELPHTTGFFFGASSDTQERMDEDIHILTKAIEWLDGSSSEREQRTVYYRASW